MKIVMLYYVMMIERIIETETKQSKCLVTCNRVKSKFSKKVTLSVIIFIIV